MKDPFDLKIKTESKFIKERLMHKLRGISVKIKKEIIKGKKGNIKVGITCFLKPLTGIKSKINVKDH